MSRLLYNSKIMTLRFRIWTLGLAVVMTLNACSSAATATVSPVDPSATAAQAATLVPATATLVAASPTEAVGETPIAVATSRGPDLEATDPTTISLASGELHFVEFFRFT